MKLTKSTNGKINTRATMLSMEAGDVISLKDDQVNLDYVRCCASKLHRTTGRTYEVNSPIELKGKIIIKRLG